MKGCPTRLQALVFRLFVVALTLVGFGVRVRGLGAKSLWFDEGLSVSLAEHPISQLLGLLVSQDIHPPLHYLILHFWMALAGRSEFAVRFPALLTGLALVPATYVLGLALFGKEGRGGSETRPYQAAPAGGAQVPGLHVSPEEAPAARTQGPGPDVSALEGPVGGLVPTLSGGHAGDKPQGYDHSGEHSQHRPLSEQLAAFLGALLVALSPFLVYYSQEARMYSDLALWGALSSLALWRGLRALGAGGEVGSASPRTEEPPPQPSPHAGRKQAAPSPVGAEQSVTPTAGGVAAQRSRRVRREQPVPPHTRGLQGGRPLWGTSGAGRWLVAYALTTALGLYTHYFVGLVIAFQVVYVALVALRRVRVASTCLLSLAGAGLLYLPWLPGAVVQMRRLSTSPDFWKGELSLAFIVEKVFTALALGKSGVPVRSLPLIAVAVLLFAGGCLLLVRRGLGGRKAELFGLLYLLVPLLALYAISARNPKFTERYLIVIAPVFYLVLARALVALADAGRLVHQRWAGALWVSQSTALAATLVVLGGSVGELQRVYAGPGYEKDDNRAAIAYVQEHEQPGDVVILMMNTEHVFKYYYRGVLSWCGLDPGEDVSYAANRLNECLAGKRRLWLLLWQEDWADRTGFVRDSIDANLARLPGPGDYHGLKLGLYSVDQPVTFTAQVAPKRPLVVNFDDTLTLLGYDPPLGPVPAGSRAELTLYWQARKPLSQDYVVSLRLRDDDYRWARHDQRPAAHTYPTSAWQVGPTVRGKIGLPVPLGIPPGDYDLELVIYSEETRRDLNVLDGDGRPVAPWVTIGRLEVGRPARPVDPAQLSIQRPLDRRFGEGLRLLGAELGAESVRPGASFDLALFWQALGPSLGDDLVALTLVDAAGQATSLGAPRPPGGRYPASLWQAGEVVIDRYRPIVPPSAAPGPARLLLGLRRLPGREPLPTPVGEEVLLATLKVGERPSLGQRPADVQHSLDLQLGELANLIGYSLRPTRARPGGELMLTLYWQAQGSSEVSYAVFTHLLDGQSRIWAQKDNPPGGGANPTTGWLPGEYVRDEYRLQIKPDAPPGEYLLEVGMYDPETNARLPVRDAQGNPAGDRVVLQKVIVER